MVDDTVDGKSFMKIEKRSGPKTVPWGTPDETVVATDDWPSSTTRWLRPIRKLEIQRCVWPLMP